MCCSRTVRDIVHDICLYDVCVLYDVCGVLVRVESRMTTLVALYFANVLSEGVVERLY